VVAERVVHGAQEGPKEVKLRPRLSQYMFTVIKWTCSSATVYSFF
jgi:hypothetical protein